jgi:prolyl oligopeptidase
MSMHLRTPLSRPLVVAAAVVLAACATVPQPPAKPVPPAVALPPPLPTQPVRDVHWGVTVDDPYRFLEDVKQPQVQAWMKAYSEATQATLDKAPGRRPLLERIQAIEGGTGGLVTTVSVTPSGRLFFLRRNPGENQFKLVWRDGPDGADHVVFDPQAGGGQPQAVMDFAPSPDGRRIAYAVQQGGGEIGVLHVADVASGRALTAPIDRIRYASVSWLDDGQSFFYSRLVEGYDKLPAEKKFDDRTRHYRVLDSAGTDRPVLSASRRPELGLPGYASPMIVPLRGDRLALTLVFMGVDRNLKLYLSDTAAIAAGAGALHRVADSSDEVVAAQATRDALFLKTSRNAPRYRIVRVPIPANAAAAIDLARAETVVPQGDGVIGGIAAAKDALYFTRRAGVPTRLYRLPHGSREVERVELPFEGEVEIKAADPDRDGVVLSLAGWTRAAKTYAYDPARRQVARLSLAADGAFDAPMDIEAREVMVRSHDDTMVPLSIVAKKGLTLDGTNPTILYGYGAYGITDDPFYSPRVYAWLERGGVWATVHVRGGGVFGRDWHEAGRKTTKPNTWKDAIAGAEWLIAQGWTSPSRLAIFGGSAGGILVGRAITERPDLFAAAVPAVGVMDAVRMENSANGAANIPEFGTVKKEDEFRGLLAMSSYHQLRDGVAYPAVMATHGVNDIRVDVWQSTKFVSRLRSAAPDGRPVLMRLEYDSGHGQGSTRLQSQLRSADVYTFMLWQFGVPGFQPRP